VSDAIVDPDWLARELDKITTDLELRFPTSLPGAVRAAVNEASRRVSSTAKISNCLPVLIPARRRDAGQRVADCVTRRRMVSVLVRG
jgi:hypothetical protein